MAYSVILRLNLSSDVYFMSVQSLIEVNYSKNQGRYCVISEFTGLTTSTNARLLPSKATAFLTENFPICAFFN